MKCDASFRAEVEAAVLADVTKLGPEGFSKAEVVRRFAGRGASRSTLFQWVSAVLDSPKPAQHLKRKVASATRSRAKKEADPAAGAARAVVAELPSPIPIG